eukprot:COSAG01_NODE_30_length_36127_cov_41.433234_10_plen_208_part_00
MDGGRRARTVQQQASENRPAPRPPAENKPRPPAPPPLAFFPHSLCGGGGAVRARSMAASPASTTSSSNPVAAPPVLQHLAEPSTPTLPPLTGDEQPARDVEAMQPVPAAASLTAVAVAPGASQRRRRQSCAGALWESLSQKPAQIRRWWRDLSTTFDPDFLVLISSVYFLQGLGFFPTYLQNCEWLPLCVEALAGGEMGWSWLTPAF